VAGNFACDLAKRAKRMNAQTGDGNPRAKRKEGKTKRSAMPTRAKRSFSLFEDPRFHLPLTAPFVLIEKMGRSKAAVGQSTAH
jgi:hypothetical protein